MFSPKANNSDSEKLVVGGGHFLSKLWITFVFSLIRHCKRFNLATSDLGLIKDLTSQSSYDRVIGEFDKEFSIPTSDEKKKKGSIKRVLDRVFISGSIRHYQVTAIWRLLMIGFTYLASYYLLKQMLVYFEAYHKQGVKKDLWLAHIHAIGIGISLALASLALQQLALQSARVGIQVRNALQVLTYRKSLKLRRIKTTTADISKPLLLISLDINGNLEKFN